MPVCISIYKGICVTIHIPPLPVTWDTANRHKVLDFNLFFVQLQFGASFVPGSVLAQPASRAYSEFLLFPSCLIWLFINVCPLTQFGWLLECDPFYISLRFMLLFGAVLPCLSTLQSNSAVFRGNLLRGFCITGILSVKLFRGLMWTYLPFMIEV